MLCSVKCKCKRVVLVLSCTCVENPINRFSGEDILVVPDEVDLLPHVAEEAIDVALAEVGGALEPIGAENTYREMHDPAFLQSVDEGGAIVPFKVIGKLALLVLDYVEVAALRPVIPEVHYLECSTVVHKENRVELVRPRSWSWVCGF